jgi:hypothetical protein
MGDGRFIVGEMRGGLFQIMGYFYFSRILDF